MRGVKAAFENTGDMVHPVTPHVGVVERSLQILQQRIDRGVVTWPPP